jgi:polyisoprenoid-binding protein YceI
MKRLKLAIAVPLALAAVVTVGTWGYIHFVHGSSPKPLTLGATTGDTATTAPSATGSVDGAWRVTSGSQAGYRVKEVLFGQSAEAVGRTSQVTGDIAISGTSVTSGSFTVDMASVASNEGRRDNQFRGRIMNVGAFPTATFTLTQPIELGTLPASGQQVTVQAKGDLTLHGTTKSVTVPVQAQRSGAGVRVAGSIPVVFAEWGIPSPSFGPAQTEDHGQVEFLLVLSR